MSFGRPRLPHFSRIAAVGRLMVVDGVAGLPGWQLRMTQRVMRVNLRSMGDGRWADLSKMLQQRRVGFLMDEVMSGSHEFEPGCGPRGTLPFEFRVSWGPKNMLSWADPRRHDFLTQPLFGTVSIGGLCDGAACEGTLKLRYFTQHTIRYSCTFAAEGRDYQYVGEKLNILPWNLPIGHTSCFGTVKEIDSGKLISRSVTHFRIKTGFDFATSFRLA